jgi:hypothetical protein
MMDLRMVTQRAAPVLAGVALFVVLVAALAGPATAAPRMGVTRARGLPAESVSTETPAGGVFLTQPLTAASTTAPVTRREDYFAVPWGAAWVLGAVGAVLLLGGARGYGLAQRRARQAPPAELPGRRAPAEERRKAA